MTVRSIKILCLTLLFFPLNCQRTEHQYETIRYGAVRGKLVSIESGAPFAGVRLILCSVTETEAPEVLGTLLAYPADTTDAEGKFLLSPVLPGDYVLLYGFPGELFADAALWDGTKMTRGMICSDQKNICRDESDTSGLFWTEGGVFSGSKMYLTRSAQNEDFRPVIVSPDNQNLFIAKGGFFSRFLGISGMIKDGGLSPRITVTGGDTIEVDCPALGRQHQI